MRIKTIVDTVYLWDLVLKIWAYTYTYILKKDMGVGSCGMGA